MRGLRKCWRLGLLGLTVWTASTSAEDPAAFSYSELERIIREKEVRTVDELLPLIPESYRKFYLFMHESRSAQAPNTFPTSPRVILYGPDSTFLMAFTKDPKAPPAVDAADTIETIQWSPTSRKFEFRELVFDGESDPLAVPPEVNPLKCQACHGRDPRPNWDAYNIWGGSFGSLSRLGCDTMIAETQELKRYQEFMSGNRKSGRYQHLPAEIPLPSQCPDNATTEVTFRNGSHPDPNALFTQQITKINHGRLYRIVKQSPRFEKMRPFLAGMLKHCVTKESLEDFFPAGFAKEQGFLSYQAALDEIISVGKAEFAQRLGRFSLHNKGAPGDSIRKPVNFLDPDDKLGGFYNHRFEMTQMRILADRMKLSMNRWSLSFSDGTYDFVTPSGMPSDFFLEFRQEVDDLLKKECPDLKTMSVANFSGGTR